MTIATFTFSRNFTDEKKSRFFLTDENGFREFSAAEVAARKGFLVCHDYWMIARALRSSCGALPKNVVDVDEFSILVSKDPGARRRREKLDVVDRMSNFLLNGEETLRAYKKNFYQENDIDIEVQEKFHSLLLVYYIEICRRAALNGELERFFGIELPCTSMCADISSKGIPIDGGKISGYRRSAGHAYYESLKRLSDEFSIPLEVPSEQDDIRYAHRMGVDLEEYGLDFALNYLPKLTNYASAVQNIRTLSATREVLDGIPVKADRVFPTIDTQGSRTSRISVRSPFLQSLPKRYRDIICSDEGKALAYVDFDQFEVGIMAALSGDKALHALFDEKDMYESFRNNHLEGQGTRKAAKVLFLAYAYGMKKKNLPIMGASFGFDRRVVREAFSSFATYEKWKQDRIGDFERRGFVSTSFGNRFYSAGPIPTKKEKLSAISQIVQGEGSLIFKKALLSVSGMADVDVLLPMHDALLFQHSDPETPNRVVAKFVQTMTDHFGRAIKGKASIEPFFVNA